MKQTMTAATQYQVSAADMEVVLALVRAGTLLEAGRRLGVDGSTVFRSVQRIERGLGRPLFERSRAGYRPTELGLELAQHAERIEVALEAARSATHTQDRSASGTVRISTTDTLLHGLVLPALRGLADAHPLLQFELAASNELASLTKRDADIAVRATRKPPGHLVGRPLGPLRFAVYGPRPAGRRRAAPSDLASCAWLAPDDAMPEHPSVQWRRRQYPQLGPRYKVNSILAVLEGVAAGLGVGVLPVFLAEGRSDVTPLSDPLPDCESQLWLLTHPESRHLRRISTVAAHLAEQVRLA